MKERNRSPRCCCCWATRSDGPAHRTITKPERFCFAACTFVALSQRNKTGCPPISWLCACYTTTRQPWASRSGLTRRQRGPERGRFRLKGLTREHGRRGRRRNNSRGLGYLRSTFALPSESRDGRQRTNGLCGSCSRATPQFLLYTTRYGRAQPRKQETNMKNGKEIRKWWEKRRK